MRRHKHYPANQRGKTESEAKYLARMERMALIGKAPTHKEVIKGREFTVRLLPSRWR